LKLGRKLTAPVSAVFLIIVAGLAFTFLHAKPEYPPPILDPQFELWVSDRELGGSKPLVWELQYAKGAGDQIAVRETVVADRKAIEIQIFQDGVDDEWAYVYLSQMIDSARLRALFSEKLGVWIFLENSCACQGTSAYQSSVFGVETNDGMHTLTLAFSAETSEPEEFLRHRTVFLHTPPGQWIYQTINVTKQYADAHWNLPERLSFSIVLGAAGHATGTHVGYVHGFSRTASGTVNSTQEKDPKSNALSSTDCVSLPRRACSRLVDRRVDLTASQGFNQRP
jgi:hypothetical protein